MSKIRKTLTKKDISKLINSKLGLSDSYSLDITSDLIKILKKQIKKKSLTIKNFGTFKVLNKNERIGRNPKNNKEYIIPAGKTLSFISSKKKSNI